MCKHLLRKVICFYKRMIRSLSPLLFFSEQVFFKPVIEDLSMELARKCTELISDVSGLRNSCLILHRVCHGLLCHRVIELERKPWNHLLKHGCFPARGTESRNFRSFLQSHPHREFLWEQVSVFLIQNPVSYGFPSFWQ